MFADNPDADYWRAPIRLGEGRTYRLRGSVAPGTTYVGVLLYRKGGQVGAHRHDTTFLNANGTFDLTISTDPAASVVGEGDEIAVMVRQYFTNRWRQTPIELKIELVGGAAPSALEPRALARSLDRARRNLEVVFKRTLET